MAFMMPVMKNEYSLYGKGNNRQRKTSGPAGSNNNHSICDDTPDRRKLSAPVGNTMRTSASAAGALAPTRRKVRSEGPSLCTSPRHIVTNNRNAHVPHMSCALESQTDGSHPVPIIRRVRGSAPALGIHPAASPLHRQM